MTRFKPKEPRYDDIFFEGLEHLDKIASGEIDDYPEMTEEEVKASCDIPKESTTCWNCSKKDTCKFAFDPYNTDGDCLLSK